MTAADWSRVDAVVELAAQIAQKEIRRMADEALIAVGVPKETVNRRRGQLNRRNKEAK